LITSAGSCASANGPWLWPEASARAAILTIEGKPGSADANWKKCSMEIERSLGAPLSELRRNQREIDARFAKGNHASVTHRSRLLRIRSDVRQRSVGTAGLISARHDGEEQGCGQPANPATELVYCDCT